VHRRNRFREGYDFPRLISRSPALAAFVAPAKHGGASIDFANPQAVVALNQALLADAYGLSWSLPRGALCPPIPGRSDYVHAIADLLSGGDEQQIPRGQSVKILDIGSGTNAVYPMIGAAEYGWSFVGTEVDQTAMRWARQIVRVNRSIAPLIEHRLQANPLAIFAGVTKAGEQFAASMCNPPFHTSAKEAAAASTRKRKNLELRNPEPLNFGGSSHELWCPGGEAGFIERMIAESAARPTLCAWFTTLVSKSENLSRLRRSLKRVSPSGMTTIEMTQGNKKSRILAWTFYRP
jgi:23S rRNA (adenine1618-N6)-methyltransferase